MKRIRGGRGLGDTLYVRGVVELLKQKVQVCSDFPEIFSDLDVETDVFSRHNINILAHYSKRKEENTNQWEDVCIQAGVVPAPMRFSWVGNQDYTGTTIIASPRIPMGRKDGFGREILPDKHAFQQICESVGGTRILVGDKPVYPVPHDIDMTGKTSVTDLMDMGYSCDRLIGQCSWIIPLAEGFDKPLLAIWSHRIEESEHQYVRRIIPRKILSGEKSEFLYDDWSAAQLDQAVYDFTQRSERIIQGQNSGDSGQCALSPGQ